MNLRRLYNQITTTKAKSQLERFALDSLLELFPVTPDDAFSDLENAAWRKTFDALTPDEEFDSEYDYEQYLDDMNFGDDEQRAASRKNFRLIESRASHAGLI